MARFNWLHLSDLHFGQSAQRPILPDILESFFSDLRRMHDRCGPFNAVFFTGDLVFSGEPSQFDGLQKNVIDRLLKELKKLGSRNVALLAVPGNHDLLRPRRPSKALKDISTRFTELSDSDAFWSEDDGLHRQALQRVFAGYSRWWREAPQPKASKIRHGILPGDFATTLTLGPFRIGIVGLNSTFVQLDGGNFMGKLVLDLRQLTRVCGEDVVAWEQDHHVNILLTHQPPVWLTKECHDDSYLPFIRKPKRFAIHLFGHMHETALSRIEDGGGGDRRYWQAPSLCGLDRYEKLEGGKKHIALSRSFGYAMGRLEFQDGKIWLSCWPRVGTKTGDHAWEFVGDNAHANLNREEECTAPREIGSYQTPTPDDSETPPDEGLRVDPSVPVNPYVGLDFYRTDRSRFFVGRDRPIQWVLESLVDGFRHPSSAPFVQIEGESGSGKSSLLHAGVMSTLRDPAPRRELAGWEPHVVVFRASDFHNERGIPDAIIATILRQISKQTRLGVGYAEADRIAESGKQAAQRAVECVARLLAERPIGKRAVLVVGLDQFEEIVDDLARESSARHWQPLLDFVAAGCGRGSIGFVATLESSRIPLLAGARLPKAFPTPKRIPIDGCDLSFLRQVIEEPFAKAGYPLCPEVVDALMNSVKKLQREDRPDRPMMSKSVLPLLSMKLSRIFDAVVEKRGTHGVVELSRRDAFARQREVTLKEIGVSLDIFDEIRELAERAWEAVDSEPGDLSFFLHPLVRLASPDSVHPVIASAPWPSLDAEKKMVEEFRKHRLMERTGNRVRFVHDAVIRHWPAAREWTKSQSQLLKMGIRCTDHVFRGGVG
jgi:predicted MPP superfamily phosphohydrolase